MDAAAVSAAFAEQRTAREDPRLPFALVAFYHASWCPHSAALRPVIERLPQYFSQDVVFVAINYDLLTYSHLFHLAVWSLPAVKLRTENRSSRYSGNRTLVDLATFVSSITGLEPLVWPNATNVCYGRAHNQSCPYAAEANAVAPHQIAELAHGPWMWLSVALLVAVCLEQGMKMYHRRYVAAPLVADTG
ncbi:hypothetical protein WJX72_002342 [[Myrmecia] bisecta]|uniref:Thioredoxin domain-containing protein n=1 Tax=[Myrmecia] bisecta TaxID=41462 RepID=A0AAW1PT86_9CHLO